MTGELLVPSVTPRLDSGLQLTGLGNHLRPTPKGGLCLSPERQGSNPQTAVRKVPGKAVGYCFLLWAVPTVSDLLRLTDIRRWFGWKSSRLGVPTSEVQSLRPRALLG